MSRHQRLGRTLRNPARLARREGKPSAFQRDARRRRENEPSYRLSPEETRAWFGEVWGVSAAMAYQRRQHSRR